jgi:hypothetical protein
MGLLSSAIGIFKTSERAIDVATKVADKGTTGIISGIDAAWYTKEEKAQDGLKRMELVRDMIATAKDENSIRSIQGVGLLG